MLRPTQKDSCIASYYIEITPNANWRLMLMYLRIYFGMKKIVYGCCSNVKKGMNNDEMKPVKCEQLAVSSTVANDGKLL